MNNHRRTPNPERRSILQQYFRFISFVLLLLAVTSVVIFLTPRTEAANKFWIASVPGNFNDDANWSLTSGGPPNTTAPGATDIATFDGNGLGNCTFTADVTTGSITIAAAYTGTITVGNGVNLTLGPFTNFVMDGGTFNTSNGTFFMNAGETSGTFDQNGGVFNGNGTLNFNTGLVRFDGGTFNATPGTTTFSRTVFRTGGTFNHNNGTVVFVASPGGGINVTVPTQFSNLTLNNTGDNFSLTGTIGVSGTLKLQRGLVQNGTIEVQGDAVVENSFGFGTPLSGGSVSLTFNGNGNQTFTNNGGPNPTGPWIVNKPVGTLTAATSIALGTSQALNITSGTLFLNNNSNLTCGGLTIGASGKLVSDSATTITLGGNATNNGQLDLQGGGVSCPQADTILLRSSVNGTRRNWSGTGSFKLSDVDVRDMGGSSATLPAITVYSGTNSGNNNSNWTIDTNCPPNPTISPAAPFVNSGSTLQFSASGGTAPYTFTLAVNNSGGSITPGGLYTAGPTKAVIDTVRVTDSFNNNSEIQVHIKGPLHHMFVSVGFGVAGGSPLAVTVSRFDVFNTLVTDDTTPVTVSIQNNPGGATLLGTLTRTPSGGQVLFDDLQINQAANGYTLRVQSGTISAVSVPFSVLPGTPAQLSFITQPVNSFATQTITPFVQVGVKDAFGNTVTIPSTVFLSVSSPANLLGATSVSTVNGVATFQVNVPNVGKGFTLTASGGPASSVTSQPFNVIGQFEVNNTNDFGPGSLRAAILNVNFAGGSTPSVITFNIPGTGPFIISPINPFPPLTHSVVIDGTTQPGYAGSPLIEVRGPCSSLSNCPGSTGLELRSGNSTVTGLAINRFYTGLNVQGPGNVIQGNYIGTNAAGTAALPNQIGLLRGPGSDSGGGTGTLIGGTTPEQRNLFSGNGTAIKPLSCSSQDSIVGNFIGTDLTGANPLPNGVGIDVFCTFLKVGGIASGERNLIAFNTNQGIKSASGSLIRGNSIHSNGKLGIDRSPEGVNATNSPGYQPPILNGVVSTGGSTTITGSAISPSPSSSGTIDFYSSPTCDASGYGEGQTYLGSTTVSFNAAGVSSFNATLPLSVQLGHFVTATTNDFLTSEFSQCRIATAGLVSISGKIVDTQGVALPLVALQLSGADSKTTSTDSNGNYSFTNIGVGLSYTVTATNPGYQFGPSSRTYNNLGADQTNQDFTGTKIKFTLSGFVTATSGFATFPLAGVKMTLSGTAAAVATAQGAYVFTNLPAGSYTLTPSLEGYVFSPSSVDLTLTNSDQQRNFTSVLGSFGVPGRILFNASLNIGSINADGTALNQLWFTGGRPSFSHDGKKIHYLQDSMFLRTRNADGTEIPSTPPGSLGTPVVAVDPPAWSPDDTKVAVTSGGPELRIVDPTGTLLTTISPPGLTSIRVPSWLSNTKLVFAAADGSDLEIYTVNSDGSGLFKLTSNTSFDFYPVASPDGTRIAFIRAAQSSNPWNLIVMGANGGSPTQIATALTTRPAWSPDGSRLAFGQTNGSTQRVVSVFASNGSALRVVHNQSLNSFLSWGPDLDLTTNPGTNVTLNGGGTTVTFNTVGSPGTTTITPIPVSSAGTVPNGFVVGGMAYEITTTSAVSAPITICFTVPSSTSSSAFNAMALLHNEGGVLVDRTTTRTFSTKQICGSVTTLSPFALGEHIENLPSIRGVVTDNQGVPMSEVAVKLDGTESRTVVTDLFGRFHFVNLSSGNYIVTPSLGGYLFTQPSVQLIGVTGENMLAFTGTPASFAISGSTVDSNGGPIANVEMSLEGDSTAQTVTASDGSYSFSNLPAGGSYTVVPFKNGLTFNQGSAEIAPLVASQTSLNFVGNVASPTPTPTPTPAPSSLNYTALGDSITFGLSDSQGGFTTRYQQDTQNELSLAVNQVNLGVPGQTSTDLLNTLRTDQSVRTAVSGSSIVTFNIGGNDLLPVIFQYQNSQCGGSDNLDCMRSAITLLKSNFTAIVAELLSLRATTNTVVRTMDFYNPFVGTLKSSDSWPNDGVNDFQAIKPFADDINNFLVTQAALNKIKCARVSTAFNGPHADEDAVSKGLIAADGIHPSPSGHALIAELLRSAAFDPISTNVDQPKIQIAVGDYVVRENVGVATISVIRSGNTNDPVSVDFATSDGTATRQGDYIAAISRLHFVAGEHLKTIQLLIVNDVINESNETFTVTLSNPSVGALINPISANIVVTNDDSGLQQPNPIDEARFFAQEHYFDFLSRLPDLAGWDFWTNEIVACSADVSCVEVKRINVSAAFFLSIEFQETGYLVERLYKAAYGDRLGQSAFGGTHSISVPIIRLNEFVADTNQISGGLVVGLPGWEQLLENNKGSFIEEFVERPRFLQEFPLTMSEAEFVDQLNSRAGNPLSQQERDQLVGELAIGQKTRAEVLRSVADDTDLRASEFNKAFVLMQYFGYLRRNPDDAPDSDHSGYDFWLTKLNQFGGNFVNAEMVKAFISSTEYRQRFAP